MIYQVMSAAEAARFIEDGDVVGCSGFTAAGCPKVVPKALAERAEQEHLQGRPFQVGIFSGASTGDAIDGALARAHAIKFRAPYQSSKDLRSEINRGGASYFDLHLSELPRLLRQGFLPRPKFAILEACAVTDDGKITLTSSVGIAPTIAQLAQYIIIEKNAYHPKDLSGIHDIYECIDPPFTREIPIYHVGDRIGLPYIQVDPAKILCVVETNLPNETGDFIPSDEITKAIGSNVADFLSREMKIGRIPSTFLPVQSGVGNIANAVLEAIGTNKNIPAFEVYTEVIQDSVIALMQQERVKFASGCSLTVSRPVLEAVYNNLDYFKKHIVLRPQEISNSPEIARRLGLIAINTALEADIFGNINSTHVLGTKMMNGIGGSGDFCRNAFLSIFTTPATTKEGKISAIVPAVSHVDHNEHSVKVLVTEYGVADLRGLSPRERAQSIIDHCVHPDYKKLLEDYLKLGVEGQTPHNLDVCFAFHQAYCKTGDMRHAEIKAR